MGFGTGVRNQFGLWGGNQSLKCGFRTMVISVPGCPWEIPSGLRMARPWVATWA